MFHHEDMTATYSTLLTRQDSLFSCYDYKCPITYTGQLQSYIVLSMYHVSHISCPQYNCHVSVVAKSNLLLPRMWLQCTVLFWASFVINKVSTHSDAISIHIYVSYFNSGGCWISVNLRTYSSLLMAECWMCLWHIQHTYIYAVIFYVWRLLKLCILAQSRMLVFHVWLCDSSYLELSATHYTGTLEG